MRKPAAILVLGMHRCGTSATTRMLNLIGADLPSNLLPPIEGNNARGFWESRDIVETNDAILSKLSSSWDDVAALKLPRKNSRIYRDSVTAIQTLLQAQFADSELFVLKDPRISRLTPLWLDALQRLDITIKCVLMVRHPLEVAASLRARDGFIRDRGLLLWLRHALDAELHSRLHTRSFVSFQDVLKDWRGVAVRLQDSLDLKFDGLDDPHVGPKVDEFLEPQERHHSTESLTAPSSLARWVAAVASCEQQLLTDPRDRASMKKLDGVGKELGVADRLFSPIISNLSDELNKLRSYLDGSIAEVDKLSTAVSTGQQVIEERGARIDDLTEEVAKANKRLEDVKAQTATEQSVIQRTIDNLENQLSHQSGVISQLTADIERRAAGTEQMEELQEALAAITAGLDQQTSLSLSLQNQLLEAQDQVHRAENDKNEIDTLRQETAKLSAERDTLAAAISGISDLLSRQEWNSDGETNPEKVLGLATERIAELTQQLERAADKNSSIKTKNTQLSDKLEKKAGKLERRKHKQKLTKGKLREARRKILSTEDRLDELTCEVDKVKAEISACEQLLGRNRRTISQLTQRTLWVANQYKARVPVARKHKHLDKASGEAPFEGAPERAAEPAGLGVRLRAALARARRPAEFDESLFDAHWYLQKYPDVASGKHHPLHHFLASGMAENRSPGPYFDAPWYAAQQAPEARECALVHYLKVGFRKNLWPNPLLDPLWYAERSGLEKQDNPLIHYARHGARNNARTHPLFDPQWYRDQYPQVARSGMDPLAFFLSHGAALGHNPHPLFNSAFYLAQHTDVTEPAVFHYLRDGWKEGRRPHPLFDNRSYLNQNADVAAAGTDPLSHYVAFGYREGRRPNDSFEASWYQIHYELGADENPLIDYLERGDRNPSPLFDVNWYRAQMDPAETADPLEHFLESEVKGAYSPHPLVDLNWYRRQHKDVPRTAAGALQHFVDTGGKEGRSPHPLFDSRWYLKTYPEVATSNENPLIHFLERGWRMGFDPNEVFSTAWYWKHVPELKALEMNPLEHYVRVGARTGADVSESFSGSGYLTRYPDLSAEAVDPLVHYLLTGRSEGRDPSRFDQPAASLLATEALVEQIRQSAAASPQVAYEQHDEAGIDIRAIAFYLPQFHPIAENDKWWGKGFTEWTNVSRALPDFVGHDQPRLPGELGFYDLRIIDNQRRQAELAHNYGIGGFCYHYYYFGGKKLLDLPLRQHLSDPSITLPFCVCWANENWTRTWDGLDSEILMAQQHSAKDDIDFIDSLIPIFNDPRYIRINGKPLLVVYRPALFPDSRKTADRWRDRCAKQGIELLLGCAQFGTYDPRPLGFDVAIEFPPHKVGRDLESIVDRLDVANQDFSGVVYRYDDLIRRSVSVGAPHYPQIKGVCPGWDNSARRPGKGTVFHGATPAAYERWLSLAGEFARQHPVEGEPLVFINAWNEWAEGAILEPDRANGYAYLAASRRALTERANQNVCFTRSRRIILVSHDAHNHGAQQNALHMAAMLVRQLNCKVQLILKQGGELTREFEEIAEVYRFDTDYPTRETQLALLRKLVNEGTEAALCNTCVVGDIVELIAQAGIRPVCMVHELPSLIREYGLESCVEQISRNAAHVVFAADMVRQGFLEFAPKDHSANLSIKPQGLYKLAEEFSDLPRQRRAFRASRSLPRDCSVVLAVGWADMRKGVDLFIQVAIQALKSDPDIAFVWVGCEEPTLTRWLNHDASQYQAEGRILLEPRTREIHQYYAASDLYLLPSREDPFPSVVLEAMSYGLPVVGFDGATGCSDLIRQAHGALVRYLDVEAMAQAVLRLLGDSDKRALAADQGRKIIRDEYRFLDYMYHLVNLAGYDTPKISVIIPNYNYGRYMAERLASVFGQSHPLYEVLVLDDASTDDSLEVLQSLREQHGYEFKLVPNTSNSGSVFAQWRKGVDMARGDLIWIAEADDLSDPQFLDSLAPAFAHREVVMAYCQSRQIGLEGELLAPNYEAYVADISETRWQGAYFARGEDELRETMVVKNTIPNVSGVLFRAESLRQTLRENFDQIQQFVIAGDWATYVELLRRGDLYYCARALNDHRRNPAGVTVSRFDESHLLEVAIMQARVAEYVKPTSAMAEKASAYAQTLYLQFGLQETGDEHWTADPRFASIAQEIKSNSTKKVISA